MAEGVEAVFTGWFREFTFPDLEAACRDVWAGAILTTASHVPFFAAKGGRAIGASFAINVMIASLTKKRAKVLGKPSKDALHRALRSTTTESYSPPLTLPNGQTTSSFGAFTQTHSAWEFPVLAKYRFRIAGLKPKSQNL